jgi:hypothetical protein
MAAAGGIIFTAGSAWAGAQESMSEAARDETEAKNRFFILCGFRSSTAKASLFCWSIWNDVVVRVYKLISS